MRNDKPPILSQNGPTLPSSASAGHGSYLGISCRHWGRRTMAENDPEPTLAVCRITSIKGTTLGARHRCSASAFTSAPSGDPKSEPPDVWRCYGTSVASVAPVLAAAAEMFLGAWQHGIVGENPVNLYL